MDKDKKIRQTIKKLEEERNQILKQVDEKERLIEEQMISYRNLYPEFFESKTNSEFILYDRFPSFKQIQAYYSDIQYHKFPHPIYQYGQFDIRELAEVIKLLYSYQRQQEYQVLTFGFLEWDGISRLNPNLYFLVGNDNTLEDYFGYQYCFLEDDSYFPFLIKDSRDLVGLGAISRPFSSKNSSATLLDINCFPNDIVKSFYKNDADTIYYVDYVGLRHVQFLRDTNIYLDKAVSGFSHYKGIKDTLSFPIHINDSFIAKALISIAIYKKNHQKVSLSNEDYRYIFHELYGEDVDIQKEIKKDIPKSLIYVPRVPR